MTDYPFNADKPIKSDTITNFCIYTEQNAEHLMRALYGFVRRPRFRWKDADEIYIGAGCYHHYGSTRNRLVWWNSELTFAFGAGGSNATSDALGNNEWHYLFLDDSAINGLATNEMTAACFLNDTTAPTWNATYHGLYTGNDRCIGGFRTGASANLLEFHHDGKDLIIFSRSQLEASAELNDSWVTITLGYVPGFSTKALIDIYIAAGSQGGSTLAWKTYGQTDTTGHSVQYYNDVTAPYSHSTISVLTSSDQKIYIKMDAALAVGYFLYTDGYYLPVGI